MELKDKLVLQKMLVGHFIETIPENCKKGVVYLLQGDGLWEKRTNKLGVFYSHLFDMDIPGLDETVTGGFVLNVPKIPATILGTIVAFFRKIYSQHQSEAFLQVLYDVKKDEYVINCPKQIVSAGSVNYNHDFEFEAGKIQVLEIHSHGNMGSFFSSVDDNDEKNDRFFGVVGNVSQYFPEMKLRLTLGGRHYEVDIDDLFDSEQEMYHSETYPMDWSEKVTKFTPKKKKKGKRTFKAGQEVIMFNGGNVEVEDADDADDAFGNHFPVPYDYQQNYHSYTPQKYDIPEDPRSAEQAHFEDMKRRQSSNEYLLDNDDDDNEEYYEKQEGKWWKVTKNGNTEIRREVDEELSDEQDKREYEAYEAISQEWCRRNNMKLPEPNVKGSYDPNDWRKKQF